MSETADPRYEFAAAFFDAIEAADAATLKTLYGPDARIWTNMSGREVVAHALLPFLASMKRKMPDRAYVDREILLSETGFVHRHRITGTRGDGATVSVRVCAIVTVKDSLVARIDEYLDSAQFAAVFS